MKGDVLDAQRLGRSDVVLGGKAAVKSRLTRSFSEEIHVPLEASLDERRIRRVALFDHAIENQRGLPAGQIDLVAVARFSTVFHDDVGIGLEDRNDLLVGWESAARGTLPN